MEIDWGHTEALMLAIAALITALGSLMGAVAAIIINMYKLRKQQNDLRRADEFTDNRVKVVWQEILKRAVREAKRNNTIVEVNKGTKEEDRMAIAMRPDFKTAFEPIAPALKRLYKQWKINPGKLTFAEVIQAEYGDWLDRHICDVFGTHNMECYVMAEIVAAEKAELPDTDKDP